MKNKILFFVFAFTLAGILLGFYYVNGENYNKMKQAQEEIVKHPEMLPKKDYASLTSFGFSNLRADIYWLETIQYIGGNAVSSEYKKYLFQMLDLITELNPYFEKPYIIGQLLLPNYNDRYESLSTGEQNSYNEQGQEIGLKGIKNFCDEKKIEAIKKEDDLEKIWTDEKYKNPCNSFDIPFGQGFLEYFYFKNNIESSNYYKVASAQKDALEGAKIMAAIMRGKGGDREKSIMMFLTLARKSKQSEECKNFGDELEQVSYLVFREGVSLNTEAVKKMEELRKELFPFSKKTEEKLIIEETCGNYINKAVRELNLYYIEQANKKYFDETGKNAKNAKELYEKKYLEFLPTDFQQYDTYGISYQFDNDTGYFDYKMMDY